MFNSNLNWDRIPNKIKRAIEASLEHLDEHKFILNDTNIDVIDDYSWDLSKIKDYLFFWAKENDSFRFFCSYMSSQTITFYEFST